MVNKISPVDSGYKVLSTGRAGFPYRARMTPVGVLGTQRSHKVQSLPFEVPRDSSGLSPGTIVSLGSGSCRGWESGMFLL